MTKRTFMTFVKDGDEDSEDQDYRDNQDLDPDWEPTSAGIDEQRVTRASLRAAHKARFTASGPHTQDSEDTQGDSSDSEVDTALDSDSEVDTALDSDSEVDAILDSDTSEAPHRNNAYVPQVPIGKVTVSVVIPLARPRICGDTKYCGKITPRIKKPVKANRNEGKFFCVICGSSFTRVEGVNYHFVSCVEKYGNPQGNKWNDHPSCSEKKTRKHVPAVDTSTHIGPSASKKRRIRGLASELASDTLSSDDEIARTQSVPQPAALPTRPRAIPFKATQGTSKTQHDSDTRIAKTSFTSTKKAPDPASKPARMPFTARRKPTQAKASRKQLKLNLKGELETEEVSALKEQRNTGKFRIDTSLPPLSDLGAIFHDMVSNAWSNIPLEEAIKSLSDKQIHIATMCSGTESPLLALGKIQDDLRLSGKPALNIKHLFSAEIVPSKQAYIERNFHPDKLFRDIREIAEGGQATTAYGALADVPSDIDILVAGFSCVDFSRLNRKNKKITDVGESGDTFRAILEYAKRYRPGVIILENVDGAPWDLIQAVWENDHESIQDYFRKISGGKDASEAGLDNFWDEDDLAYSAAYHRVDAKNYYIPQTRTRRYMLCVDRHRFGSSKLADEAVQRWKQYMVSLERKASVSVEAFLLPGDDRRLQRAKDELSKIGKPRREVDWEVCHGRHELYRQDKKLGVSRPVLEWTNDGTAKASGYFWTDWTSSQVERIWDSIEVCYLRNAVKGFDSFYKPRFWELSQNIDRFMDDTPAGVVSCLTPTGQPFSSVRGGPITGLEAIALQGLPIDTLLLTRESERELFDLAGNAMTSTVVGAALLAGLTVSHKILTRPKKSVKRSVQDSGSDIKQMRYSELRPKQILSFDGSSASSLEELCQMANASVRLCHCEAQTLTAPALIRVCKCCHHHCCEKCGNLPKHDYELVGGNGRPVRIEPQEFRKRVRCAIPTRLEIDGFSSERIEGLAQLHPKRSEQDWRLFSEAILLAMEQEYRYESIKRSHCWRIIYNSPNARLELVFHREGLYWLLYGKPGEHETGDSRVRKLLGLPLARLTVRGKTMRGETVTGKTILDGSWEIHIPAQHAFQISVTPQGKFIDSWEKKLGLQGESFIDKQVPSSLRVARTLDSATEIVLDYDICGDYDLLENCGTACSSLHKKRPTADSRDAPALFLFLDPDRLGKPDQDCYVFSKETQRLEYGESRYIVAKVESYWRPPHKGSLPKADSAISSEIECTVPGRWEPYPISLRPHDALGKASLRLPKGELSMPVFGMGQYQSQYSACDTYGCLHDTATTALLACEIPGQLVDSAGWQIGRWTIIDQKSERQVAAAFAWLFARVEDLGDFNGSWRSIAARPRDYQNCLTCAPKLPKVMWTCSRGGRQEKVVPYEDGREAGDFERRIKARPAPFLVQTYVDDDEKQTGRLSVGLNLPTLAHRALARLINIEDSDKIDMEWRLDTRYEAPTRYRLRDFTLTNNKLHLQAQYAFPTGEKLRPEQKRSLQWMIGQEADDMSFYEEEIEEATLLQMSWRAEVRVRRDRILRGGILADEVGYGKTATTLALIGAQETGANKYARNEKRGSISTQATLILVPYHLVHQWKGQTLKFLGIDSHDDKLLVIEDVSQLAKTSVKRIKAALVIIASWRVLRSPAYMVRMSHFAALPQGPSSGERETEAWLTRACANIKEHMAKLNSEHSSSPKDLAKVLKKKLKNAYDDQDILRDVPTQRLKGAKYATWNPLESVQPQTPSPNKEELERYFKHMTAKECKNLDSMTGILLHMFDFYRIVVDEYTYVDDLQQAEKISNFITTINARSRWVLSGTPNIQDFGDVRNLASFLGYNLGVVDDAAGVLKGATIRHIRGDRTAAEQFRAFGYSHTAAWHISRQAHAQEFLDRYASKNVAEIGIIKSRLHLRPHFLGAAETILNAELQQQLQSTEMKIVLHGKSKKDNDRLRRYNDLLRGCKTAAECLLKACAYFELEKTQSAKIALSRDAMDVDHDDEDSHNPTNPASIMFGACQTLITIRERQMLQLVAELEYDLLHAAWLEKQGGRAKDTQHRDTHYCQWKSEMEGAGLRDPTATSNLRRYLETALEKVDGDTEEIYYRDPPTREEIKKENAAARERKKQEKSKRTAIRRAKNASGGSKKSKTSRKTKAAASSDEELEESWDSDSEAVQAEGMDPDPPEADDVDTNAPDSKPNKIHKNDTEVFVSVLRSLTGHLRSLVLELTSRTRSLRFARGAQELCQWYTGLGEQPKCRSCGKDARDHDDISINIRCGHLTCKKCIQKASLVVCAVNGCDEGSESYRLKKAVDLVGEGETLRNGSRLGNIVKLINSLPKDEQVLLFVQFEDVMLNIASGLEAANISNYALSKKAGRGMIHMMNDFQDNQGEGKKKVLLLNPSNETASGINLTNANHIIFVSPLLTNSQQSYNASMTQCIGRAKRYGQQKMVHVYRFLALKSIDVDIVQEREEKTLVKENLKENNAAELRGHGTRGYEGEWLLVEESAIEDSMEGGWGSGYNFKSNPTGED